MKTHFYFLKMIQIINLKSQKINNDIQMAFIVKINKQKTNAFSSLALHNYDVHFHAKTKRQNANEKNGTG